MASFNPNTSPGRYRRGGGTVSIRLRRGEREMFNGEDAEERANRHTRKIVSEMASIIRHDRIVQRPPAWVAPTAGDTWGRRSKVPVFTGKLKRSFRTRRTPRGASLFSNLTYATYVWWFDRRGRKFREALRELATKRVGPVE